ncbi:hypothetical protein C8R44DRAFT_778658 [Mycena epipterygia]|nr:hypothetical protein C8R44DRAFT_778658 [Mycena epipterygia]
MSNAVEASRANRAHTGPYSSRQFPEIPVGVVITPFKDFKECGIQRVLGFDGVERDHLGIPTTHLLVKHDTDVSKTNPDPKIAATVRPRLKKEWWDDWEEGEHLRMHGPYDHTLPRLVLFRRAAADFQKYRRFPGNVFKPLWELTFKIYTGINGTTPVWQIAGEKPYDDEVSDDDFEKFSTNVRPREPYELYDVQPHILESKDDIPALLAASRAERDTRAQSFLANPATAIQIYLSSYMYEQGLVWSNDNLVNAPYLLRFFVKFLLRNQVLPDCEEGLNRALDIIELAGQELPLTSKISKAFPDEFSTACQNLWGPSVDRYTPAADSVSAFEASLRAENIEVINAEDVTPSDTASTNSASVADDGGWSIAPPSATDWDVSAPATLFKLLGPTALPLTHAPGAVEQSVRRITRIRAPAPAPANINVSPLGVAADAVERELGTRMYRVELDAWSGWDTSGAEDDAVPVLLSLPSPSSSDAALDQGNVKLHTVEAAITLLVEPATAEHLRVGMGLGGIWVQLARLPVAQTHGDTDPASEGFWYLDKLMRVLPSYWISRT